MNIRTPKIAVLALMLMVVSIVLSACGGASKQTPAPAAPAAPGAAANDAKPEPKKYPSEKLLIGMPAPNAVYWDVFVAIEKGFFKEEALEAELITTKSSSGSVQQLAAKAINLGLHTPDVLIAAHEKGATNLKILFTTMNRLPWSLIVKGNIKGFADLKGKVIGVSALKGGETSLTKRLLAKHGLKEGDYDLRVVGATPQKYAALQNGSVDIAVLYQPTDFVALEQGFKRLAFFTELEDQFPFPVYATDTNWAGQNERGVRVVRALVKSHKWLYDPANRAEALQILQKHANVDPKIGEATYKLFFEELKAYSKEGEVDLKGLKTAIDIMVEDGDIPKAAPPEKFVEAEMLKKGQAK